MKRYATLTAYLILTAFIFSFANCRTGSGARKTKGRREIEYQQKKIDKEREERGIN